MEVVEIEIQSPHESQMHILFENAPQLIIGHFQLHMTNKVMLEVF